MADQNLNIMVRVQGAQQSAAQIKEVGAATEQVGTQTKETNAKTSALRRTLGGLATGFAVYKGAQFIKGAVDQTIALGAATRGLERITGMDAKTASGWVAVAHERNITTKQLNFGFITLSRQIAAAHQGTKTAIKTFQQLGVTQDQLRKMNTQQVIGRIADAFQHMHDPAQRAALAQRLFGRNAQAMLPLLAKGSDALNKNIATVSKQAGITGNSVKQSLEMVKAQREMTATMLGFKVAVATALMPILVSLTQVITPIASAFGRMMQASLAFRVVIVSLTAGITAFIVVAKALALAGLEVDAAWLLIPAALVAVGVGLVLLYKHCAWFRNAVHAAMAGVVAAFNWVKNAAAAAFNWVKGHWPLLVSILGGPLAAAAIQIARHFGQIRSAASGAFNAVKSVAQGAARIVGGVFKAAWDAVYGAIRGVVIVINQVVSAANRIARLPGKVLNAIGGGFSSAAGAIGGLSPFQHGGYMSHAGAAIVGEAGPEFVRLPQGAQVQPFMPSHGRGGGATIHTHVYLDSRQIAVAMGNYVADQQAAR